MAPRVGIDWNRTNLVAIPFVNKGVDVVFTSRVMVSKSEVSVTVDVERLDIVRSVSLKGLQFDEMTS